MDGAATIKVPDGKLIELRATYDDRYEDVTITGDFFLEPPAALADLEAAIEGQPTDADREQLAKAVAAVDAELIGFAATDLAAAAREAVR